MIQGYLAAWPQFSRNSRLFLLSATIAGFSYSGIYFLLANLFLVRLGLFRFGQIHAGALDEDVA